ncbi:MAG: hypothetical protein S4CHLAM102_12790 [Chlamydiia bacterium]|nr:hypothetical protein [Chlamydiia bacterium]
MKKKFLPEEIRIQENEISDYPVWEKWGPYVSERGWGTVREDFGKDGSPWTYMTYENAAATSYQWNEDGIAGISDRYQVLVFSLALWNQKDPILKERLFGLTPDESNHGEDVKEYYYYLENTPTHSYMKYLYKYPQSPYPYEDLREKSKKRTKQEPEYELLDTGIFDTNEYFDIFVEYAKITDEDLAIRIEVVNRSDKPAALDLIPQIQFRNFWKWNPNETRRPTLSRGQESDNYLSIVADHKNIEPFPMLEYEYDLEKRYLFATPGATPLFTDNESNKEKLGTGTNSSSYTKEAFHDKIIHNKETTNKEQVGTKACFHYSNIELKGGESKVFWLRLTDTPLNNDPLSDLQAEIDKRKGEADAFYNMVCPPKAPEADRAIQKAALSQLLWNRQAYFFICNYWLKSRQELIEQEKKEGREVRNSHWRHLVTKHILQMPDKWEYPWFAAWDLCFHAITLALVDIQNAKEQIWFLLSEQVQHPNGSIAAYEWEFSDLNPPIQGWATLKLYQMEKEKLGRGDVLFLKKCYHKLVLNFVCWVNRVDKSGNNVFEGGFLGLDNIAVIDRSHPLPNGGTLEQSDGTGWMGLFCLDLMRISIELSRADQDFESMIAKYFQHFIYISNALTNSPNREVQNWSEEDGFFYDVISFDDGSHKQIPVRSLVGIIPVFALDWISEDELFSFEEFRPQFDWFIENRQSLTKNCVTKITREGKNYYLFSLVSLDNLKRILTRIWDPAEFRSEYGLRSLSKYHEAHPIQLDDHKISYEPGESTISMYGGNSNWRGSIWAPTTYLLIETLRRLYDLLGDEFTITAPNEEPVTLKEMADYFSNSLIALFREKEGRRPIYGDYEKMQSDPHWNQYIQFFEYFHGDTGRGCGASHQSGWSSLVANLINDLYKERPSD